MKNRPITTRADQEKIIRSCQTCTIAMVDPEGKPYVIPMNFGFDGEYVYFHGSQKGKKAELLRKKPEVCILFSTDHELRYVTEDVACSWSMKYRSVLAYGKVTFVEDEAEKVAHLNQVMKNYSPKEFKYNPPSIREVCCWKVDVERFEGRVYGY